MAYWLYCQACRQWSKSSTPLSDDKTCSFCYSLFVKTKKPTLAKSNNVIEEKNNELQNRLTIPSTDDLTNKNEDHITSDFREVIEKQETSIISEPPIENDPSAKPDTLESTFEETESLITHQSPETPEEPINNETIEISEPLETYDTIVEEESSVVQGAHEVVEDEEFSTVQDDITEEPESFELEETLEESDSSVEQKEPDSPEPKNTPAHRMFIEDRRRKRNLR